MRFTVHDSPDYYQLKVSIFNDDKRTELIGETWIALEQIIKPGGGKNDLWHQLNCKGRFAGEIRTELTYYDTRPREETSEERRNSAPLDVAVGQPSSGVSGPRQPKPVKRRPLPVDPTDPARSASLPQLPPSRKQQLHVESPDDYAVESSTFPERQKDHLGAMSQAQSSHNEEAPMISPNHRHGSNHADIYERTEQNELSQRDLSMRSYGPQDGYEQSAGHGRDHIDDWQSRPLTQPLQHSQGMIHSHSMPAMVDPCFGRQISEADSYSGSSPPKSHSYETSSAHYDDRQDRFDAFPDTDGVPMEHEEAPPPPPVHRNSGTRPMSISSAREDHSSYSQVSAPAPLNIRNGRGSITGSPLSQSHSSSSFNNKYPPPTSPSNSQMYSQPVPSPSSRTSYSQPQNQRSLSPLRDFDQPVPPSLVPGYAPSIADDESERIIHERQMTARHHYSDLPRPQFEQGPTANNPLRAQYEQVPASIEQVESQYQRSPAPAPQVRSQPRSRNIDNVHDRRVHRSSAPVIQPQTTNVGSRTPLRKSVSPSPGSAPERRRSEIPFSPDSFDAFNPSMNSAGSVNEPSARYNTPEQAKEAASQHQRQEKLGDGPIIGNDGRIIDPSDHLPTDTWAPEPEQKTPKKGPQVTMRFRHSPQGAQPMPAARRPAVEHSASTPIYPTTLGSAPPSPAGRIRLQKKALAGIAQPASSPMVPTLNTTPRSSPLRTSESNYPLRERENYGSYGSSPTYGRPSPGNIPPPIPGKIPINGGQEDWDTHALSEEMSRIDIGVGGGQKRQRSRFVARG